MENIFEEHLDKTALDLVFKNMEDAVCVTNKHGIIYYMNEAASTLLSADGSAPGKEKIWKLIPYTETNDELIQMFIDATVTKKITHHGVVDFEKNDGSVCKLSVNITYTYEEDEQFIVVVITNLTELFRVNAAFRRYTSNEIADFVLNTPEGEKQGGKQSEVTIMMSDLRGFTALSTRIGPEQLITILNHYFAVMSEIIEKHHGTVIEFLGDGIFVVFGAPKEDKDHAKDAVECAIEMENAMVSVNEWNQSQGYPDLQMGIGINSGLAVVGNIGSENKMKYGCMGETVNLAGRVESFTIGGQIYVSENTKALIDQKLSVSETQSIMPKGAKKEISIYSVVGIGELMLTSAMTEIKWEGRERDLDITFKRLEGKAVEDETLTGKVIKLSEDLGFARMTSDIELTKSTNIMIDIGGDLYAKVTDVDDKGYVICFTSKPESFASWVK